MKRPTADEYATVLQVLEAVGRLRCVDSDVSIQVSRQTFDRFAGYEDVIADDDGAEPFASKVVLTVNGECEVPGSCITVRLWTSPLEPRVRHLRVA